MYSFDEISNFDSEVAKAMTDEINRQDANIELIASENIVSKAVMAAMGSPLTNSTGKYGSLFCHYGAG